MTYLPLFIRSRLGLTAAERSRTIKGSAQHDGEHFYNIAPRPVEGFYKVAKIAWNMLFNKPRGTVPTKRIPIDVLTRSQLDADADRSAYRLGHSTVLLKLQGKYWLTDPIFSERASPFRGIGPKRFHVSPIPLGELPDLRAVILSHDHYDHLDRETIIKLADKTDYFLTPLGVGDRLIEWGIDPDKVKQFDWWNGTEIDGVRLTATPAQHFSGRSLLDNNRTLWASWVIDDGGMRMFFSGDTGYCEDFKLIGEKFGHFDATFIETGAYNSLWPYVHMQPEESVQAHIDLRGRWLIPIHNGTFDLALHRWEEPFERVTKIASELGISLCTPHMGQKIDLMAPCASKCWWRETAE